MTEEEILTQFLLDTQELEILESMLDEFNPLSIMKVENYEIRHSNILSWLFDPSGNHHLNDRVIKKFITEVILNNETVKIPFNIRDIYLADFNDAEIFREYKNIDILIKSEINKTLILIENKIKSKESEGQLEKYFDLINREYPAYKIIPVLLTVYGDEPIGSDKYIMFSHESLYRIIKNILHLEKNHINQKVADFISYYLKSMELILMENEEIIRLCKDIYNKHKKAIDIINKYASTSELSPAFDAFITGIKATEVNRNNNSLWFLPEDLKKMLPIMNHSWQSPYPLSFWFRFSMGENAIKLIFEVGPWDYSEKRLEFINYLESKGLKFNKKAFSIDARYTRIFSQTNKFSDWDNVEDNESIIKEMNKLYSEINKDKLKGILDVVKAYDWTKINNNATEPSPG
jgi:hypothetical protein